MSATTTTHRPHHSDHSHSDHSHSDHSHSDHSHEDHSHAGQGAVLLDIGGDVGALIVHMPAELAGTEIEICPAGEEHFAAVRAHVAVIRRPAAGPGGYTAVFPSLTEGRYELYRKSAGPTEVIADVLGGQVSETNWPDGGS